MTEMCIFNHSLSLFPCGLFFANSYDWTQKASDVNGSFKCNDKEVMHFGPY